MSVNRRTVKRRNYVRSNQRKMVLAAAAAVLLVSGLLTGWYAGRRTEGEDRELQDPVTMTPVDREALMRELGSYAVCAVEYTNKVTRSGGAQGQEPVRVLYSGVVEVAYDPEEITCEIDAGRALVCVGLPKPRIVGHRLRYCLRLDGAQAWKDLEQMQAQDLIAGQEKRIYEKAERQMRAKIEKTVSALPGYRVEVTGAR